MKIGDKVLVPNYIAFEKKSEAIALTVIQGICKISEKTHGKIQKGIEKNNRSLSK